MSPTRLHPKSAPARVDQTRCEPPTAAQETRMPGPSAFHRLARRSAAERGCGAEGDEVVTSDMKKRKARGGVGGREPKNPPGQSQATGGVVAADGRRCASAVA